MGWSDGSALAEKIWYAIRRHIPEGRTKILVARTIIKLFENEDCDTIDEADALCADAKRKQWKDGIDHDKFEALPEYEPLE